MCFHGPTCLSRSHSISLSGYTGSQSAIEPDLQVQGAGAPGEDTQPTGLRAGVAGPPGGLQTQRPPEGSGPQPPALGPQ